MEIERKFLTPALPRNITDFPSVSISQCYISKSPTIRIRKMENEYFLTVKGKGHMARQEFEMPITQEEYENLLKKTDTPVITKRRYRMPLADGLQAEIDIFAPPLDGLILTEVEFDTEEAAQKFTPPHWFGEDVTFDPQYKNVNLMPDKQKN